MNWKMFWKKKEKSQLSSHEFEELTKKVIAIVGDIDRLTNSVTVLDSIVKSNRARICKIKIQEIEMEGEKSIKDDPKYI